MASILDSNPLSRITKTNTSRYNRYTSDFNDFDGGYEPLDNKYMAQSSDWADAVELDTGRRPTYDTYLDLYKREMRNRYLDSLQNARRGGLDRTIDALSVFNYGIAGFAKGMFDNNDEYDQVTPLQGLLQGIRASNPFGQGYVRGENTFSDVMESAGWKPESTLGKIAKGTAGFILDVGLDPSTYLTFGAGAVVKGTGVGAGRAIARNAGKEIATREGIKFKGADRLANDVYEATKAKYANTNINADLLERLAQSKRNNVENSLQDVKQAMTTERATEIVTDRLKRNGTFSKASPEQIKADADNFANTFNRAMGYNRKGKGVTLSLGNAPFGDKIFGKSAASKELQLVRDDTLRKLSDKGLGKVYAHGRNAFYGSRIGKLLSTKTDYNLLAKRNPTELYNAIKFADITRGLQKDKLKMEEHIHMLAKGFNMSPAEAKQILNLMQDEAQWKKIKPFIELRNTEDAAQFRKEIANLQMTLRDKIDELRATQADVENLSVEKAAQLRVAEKTLESLTNEKAFKLLEVDSSAITSTRELEKQLESLREEMRNLVKTEQSFAKPNKNADVTFDDYVDKMQNIMSDLRNARVARDKHHADFDALHKMIKPGNDSASNALSTQREAAKLKLPEMEKMQSELAKMLNDLLYDGRQAIASDAHIDSLSNVMKMFDEYAELDDIRKFIDERPKLYTPEARAAQRVAANVIGYKDWNKVYTEPMEKLKKARDEQGQLLPAQRQYFDELQAAKARRDALLDTLYSKSLDEINAFAKQFSQDDMNRIMDEAEDLFNSTGYSVKSARDKQYERFINPDRSAELTMSYKERKGAKVEDEDADIYGIKIDPTTGEERYDMIKRSDNDVTGKLSTSERKDIRGQATQMMSSMKLYDKQYADLKWFPSELTPIQESFIRDVMEYASGNLRTFYKKEYSDLSSKQVEALIKTSVNKALHEKGYFGFGKKKKTNVNLNSGNQISYVGKDGMIRLATIATYNKETGEVILSGKTKDGTPTMKSIHKNDVVPTVGKKMREKLNAQKLNEPKQALNEFIVDKGKQQARELMLARMEEGSKLSFSQGKKDVRGVAVKIDGDNVTVRNKAGEELVIARDKIKSVGVKADDPIALMRADADALVKQLDALPAMTQKAKNVLSNEYNARIEHQQKLIDELEDVSRILADSLRTGEFKHVDALEDKVKDIEDALSDADAFESYMRLKIGEDGVKKALENVPAKFAFDMDASYSEKVKSIAKTLRFEFMEMARKEVGIKKLKQEQVDELMMRYVPRILTPEGETFFRGKKDAQLESLGISLTKDYGYGTKFNPHSKERKIKFLKLDSGWVKNPTIDQLNEYFAPMLNGKNAYLDNLADLYISRALKHNELMYDDHYMRNMLNVFGKELPASGKVEKGFKAVMNHGMMREFVSESAGMIVSMRIGREVSSHLKQVITESAPRTFSREEIKGIIETYLKTNITPEVAGLYREQAMTRVLSESMIGREALGNYKLPMVELNDLVINGSRKLHADIKQEYTDMIYGFRDENGDKVKGRFDKAMASGDDEYINRVLGNIAKLEAYKAPQIAQVNDAIVQKANQARKIQIAKDEHRLLQMYDKLTHLIKLNMTTVVPAFHARNKVANMYLNWLNIGRDAFDMRLQKKAFDVVRKSGQGVDRDVLVITKPDGTMGTMTWTELWNEAKSHGVVDEGFFAKDIGASARTTGIIKTIPAKFDPTDSENFLLYKAGGRIGNTIENTDRLVHFAALIRKGTDPTEAARQVKEFLFDYSDLTRFEQSIMKRLIPFYTWLRKNGALQLDSLLERTEKMQLVAKTFNGVEGMNNEEDMIDARYLSNFAEDWVQTPFSAVNEFGNREPILWSPNLPINDLSRIPDPFNIRKTIENLFSQSNAIFKAPLEQAMNKQVFFDSEITEEGDGVGAQVAKRANHIASHNALYNTLKAFFNKEGVDSNLNILATTTGIKFSTYDVEGYIRNHIMKKGQQKDIGLDELSAYIGTKVSNAAKDVANSIAGTKPDRADEYTGALRPISKSTYDKLSASEKEKYTPPTYEQAYALNRQAQAMSKKASADAGVVKKFIWAIFDGVGEQEFEIGNVERVIDGDTFEVRVGSTTKKIRMLLVDTPETVHPNRAAEPFGKEASDYSKGRLFQKDVKLVFDGSRTDNSGRTLAYVEIPSEDVDYNKELIESGLGVKGYEFQDYYDRGSSYEAASNRAKRAQRGVYSVPGYADKGAGKYDVEAYKRYLERLKE